MMSLTVPASPVAVELCSTSDEQPVIVRAHARARAVRAASTGTAWGDVYARQRKRVDDALKRYQAQAWRTIIDPVRERAQQRLYAEMGALDALGTYAF